DAGGAVARPEVDDHRATAQIGEPHRISLEVGKREIGRGRADEWRGSRTQRQAADQERQQDERQDGSGDQIGERQSPDEGSTKTQARAPDGRRSGGPDPSRTAWKGG